MGMIKLTAALLKVKRFWWVSAGVFIPVLDRQTFRTNELQQMD